MNDAIVAERKIMAGKIDNNGQRLMKVMREGKKFEPITIVLETEEEASFLWHKLNSTGDWYDYTVSHKIRNVENMNDEMWDKFSAIYRPEGE